MGEKFFVRLDTQETRALGGSVSVQRARSVFLCECGDPSHSIQPGDYYLLESIIRQHQGVCWNSCKYRWHVAHLENQTGLQVVDRQGHILCEFKSIPLDVHSLPLSATDPVQGKPI